MTNSTRLDLAIEPDLKEKCRDAAKKRHMTLSAWIRMLVVDYFSKRDQ